MRTECHFATREECARFGSFLAWLAARGRSPATARSYRSDWQDLAAWYRRARGAPFSASVLDAEGVADWRDAGVDKGKSAATVTRRLAFARTYAGWLADEGVLSVRVADTVRAVDNLAKAARAPRILTDPEVHLLLRQVDERGCRRDQAILYVLLDTGVKVSELVGMDVGDLDFLRGELHVRRGRRRQVALPTRTARKLAWSLAERGLLEVPATGEIVLPATGGWPPTARVPMPNPALLPVLAEMPASPMPYGVDGPPARWPLFVGERGRLTANAAQRIVRKHATFARIDASPQVLRHTFAHAFWARTQDLVTLALQLGQTNVESARIYTQITAPDTESVAMPDNVVALTSA